MVIELRVVQFWSEIMLTISNRTLAAHSSDLKITCKISDQIHSTYPFSFIAGFHCHASKNKNKTINSRIWEMKWGWYRKTLAKIQVSMIFHTRNILRNCLPKIIERFLCPSGWAPTWPPETTRNICHWVLLLKGEFISQGTHKH